MPSIAKMGLGLAALVLAAQPAFADATDGDVETVVVIGNAPLPGSGIDADKVPGEVQTISIPDLTRDRRTEVLANTVASQFSGVSLNDEQGSQFQPDFVYRGFEASPISGIAEGVAVYQDGVRLNESFGDNVNWDLVPQFAVRSLTLQSNDPVFGLNTMGGAVNLSMRSGLDFQGAESQLSGGSFGNVTGDAEYGARFGDFGVYLGIGGVHDDGFRYRSPTTLRQGYGDVGYESGALTLHLSASAAVNDIAAVGPTPVEMLAQDPKSVFTFPQAIRNEMELTQLRATWHASDALTFSANTYYRHFLQHLTDGNTTDVDYCENDPSQLCLEGDGDFPGDALYDNHGNPVPASVLPDGATPGETDFTRTNTNAYGAAVQMAATSPLFWHANNFVLGASLDRGTTNYTAFGELGALEDNLEVVGVGVIIDQGLSPTASPPIEEPVNVDGTNTYTGVYAIDVFDVTPALSWTVSGRLNLAEIELDDRIGTALDGEHHFTHFNPGTGLTYKLSDHVTAYAGYSQSNRAPTAGELSCADPASPCLLDAFLVSDPPLKQVVSFNYEAGLRGNFQLALLPGAFSWNAGVYRTDATNDILLLSTDINGFGFFQNAGTTRHQGADLHLGYRDPRWSVSASYSYLDATFQSFQALSSDSPAANADGLIFVHPGNHIPLNPANRLTLSADYTVTPDWRVGADLRAQSGQYLVGDESNQEAKLPGYATVDLHTDYKLDEHLELFAEADNVFDKRYYSYGAFTELDGLPPNFDLTDPRTYSPNPGRTLFIGMRAHTD
ncbi:MAG TPA: TonB-dependent receptor [Rhizomicrobium sp.]|nr:TonB-dependent receptor [Rhizomicrobium sp.]